MTKNKFSKAVLFAGLVLAAAGCKDQLNVGNPNLPTYEANVTNETGVIALAQGGVYINGFSNGDGWLGDSYFSLVWGYSELLADNVGADASNNQVTTIAVPDYYKLSDGTQIDNTGSSTIGIVHAYNTRAATGAGNNALYYQWLNMYALNNAMNQTLAHLDGATFGGDAETRKSTIRAWAYFWKGYAYSSIGLQYYSGIITNTAGVSSNEYVLHDVIIAESDKYYNKADSTLATITATDDYDEVIDQLIPEFTKTGNGGHISIPMFQRNIHTLLARNILLNRLSPFVNGDLSSSVTGTNLQSITAADWAKIKDLTNTGITDGDKVFTGRTTGAFDFFTSGGGTVPALTVGTSSASTFKISERYIQNFDAGDARLTNNFVDTIAYKNNYIYTTRYEMIDGGAGLSGVPVYGSSEIGGYELIIAGSLEENELTLAEADIRTGSVSDGVTLINKVRGDLHSGLPDLSTGLSAADAMTALVRERRITMAFKGVSYYDVRRWGWTYDIANGGGSYGNVIIDKDGVTEYDDVTINYNFMDFWDVPADESVVNPASPTSASTTNVLYPK